MALNRILARADRELKAKNLFREKMLSDARRILKLSKESILLTHKGKLKLAEQRLKKAERLLRKNLEQLEAYPELKYGGALSTACQDYAEALFFLSLERGGGFPIPEEVGVNLQSYLLGLADVPGELRRRVVEELMAGNLKAAERRFKLMEEIYGSLITLDEHVFSLVSGLRRKCDVIRHLLELTGSDLVVERRQRRLEKTLKSLERYASKFGRKEG